MSSLSEIFHVLEMPQWEFLCLVSPQLWNMYKPSLLNTASQIAQTSIMHFNP